MQAQDCVSFQSKNSENMTKSQILQLKNSIDLADKNSESKRTRNMLTTDINDFEPEPRQLRKRNHKQQEKQEEKTKLSVQSDGSESTKEFICHICSYFTTDKNIMLQQDNNIYNYPEQLKE